MKMLVIGSFKKELIEKISNSLFGLELKIVGIKAFGEDSGLTALEFAKKINKPVLSEDYVLAFPSGMVYELKDINQLKPQIANIFSLKIY